MNEAGVQSGCPMAKIDRVSEDVLSYIRKKLKKRYRAQKPEKAFHVKTIGLVKAKLIVDNDLPPDLRIGLFKEKKTYEALVRFSNGSPNSKSADNGKDLRGMAIKVLGVESEKFLDDDTKGKTQDIILCTSRVTIPGPADQQLAVPIVGLGNVLEKISAVLKVLPSLKLKAVTTFLKGTAKTPNILEEMYYSATPYSFGTLNAIKWHARPLKTIVSVMPEISSENFLRQRLIKDLSDQAREEISFLLMVQFQEKERTEPIEDPSVEWKTKFHRVATIIIPKQDIDTLEREKEDNGMYFSPGHAMIEHAPLGGVNAVRRKVYATLANERLKHP